MNKRIFILLLILPIIILSLLGCASSRQEEAATPPQQEESTTPPQPQEVPEEPLTQEEGSTSPPPYTIESPPSPPSPPSAPSPPIEVNLRLSHVPKVGETAQATLTVFVNCISVSKLGDIKAWLEFSWTNTAGSYQEYKQQIEIPSEEVLVSGDLNWEGVLTAGGASPSFNMEIKFPKEGIWEITGYIEGNVGHIRSNRVKLAVEHDRACIFGSEDYYKWWKDYSPSREYIPDSPDNIHPVVAKLDLSNPPRLGEPVELTWSIISIKDIANAKAWTGFRVLAPGSTQSETATVESMLVEGSLSWEGAIKKDIPISSSATVIFPEEGDWETILYFRDSKTSYSTGDSIFLNVTEERGRWGWAEPHERDWSNVPPPPRAVEPPKPEDKQ